MQKSSVQVTVHFKNLKFQNTGNQMKEIQVEIHSSWGEETYLKAKNVENFADVQRYTSAVQIN